MLYWLKQKDLLLYIQTAKSTEDSETEWAEWHLVEILFETLEIVFPQMAIISNSSSDATGGSS